MNSHPCLQPMLRILLAEIVFYIMLVVTAPANAQNTVTNPCNLTSSSPIYQYRDYIAPITPACTTPTETKYIANLPGVTSYRYCRQPDGTWKPQWSAAARSAVTSQMMVDFLKAGPQPSEADIAALTARYVTLPLSDPILTPVWCPNWQAIWDGRPQPVVAPTWVVAGPVALQWATDGRSLGALQASRAVPGTACSCPATPLKVGTRTYCPPAGAPATTVAICTRTP